MAKWQYRVFTVDAVPGRDIDLDVESSFDEWQDDGWEYVSGPLVDRFPSGAAAKYTFFLRRGRQQRSAYEDHDLTVI